MTTTTDLLDHEPPTATRVGERGARSGAPVYAAVPVPEHRRRPAGVAPAVGRGRVATTDRPGAIGSVVLRPTQTEHDVAGPVNPRIASRRADVERNKLGTRRRRRLVGAGLVGVAAAVVATLFSPLVGLRSIRIIGTDDRARIIEESGVGIGTPLLRVSPSGVQRRLQALPDIAEAKVSRQWLQGLTITVVPREPVALIVGPTNTALIGANGAVIRSVPSVSAGLYRLPRLDGVAPASVGRPLLGDGAVLGRTAAALGPLARASAVGMHLQDGTVVLTLELPDPSAKPGGPTSSASKMLVRFGSPAEGDLKSQALEAILASDTLRGFRTVDLGVPDAPILGP